MIKRENLKDLYPLSPMQEGMLYQCLLDPDDTTYHQQVVYTLQGEMTPDYVELAWRNLVSRHEMLRTVFVTEKVKRPLQAVLHESPNGFHYQDLSLEDQPNLEDAIEAEQGHGFDLQAGPLMRLTLLKSGEAAYTLIWSHHHILMDGWCVSILLNEFTALYEGYRNADVVDLPSPPLFSRYIKWLEQQDHGTAKSYWHTALESQKRLCQIPQQDSDHASDAQERTRQAELHREIPRHLCSELDQQAQNWRITTGSLLQACWAILLSKYNNEDDVVFGTLISGRPSDLEGAMEMLGLFINTIPIAITLNQEDTLHSIANRIQNQLLDSVPYQHLPLSDIQQCSALGMDLVKHVFAFENFPTPEGSASFSVSSAEKHEQVPYDFGLVITPRADELESAYLELNLLYDQNKFSARFVDQLSRHFIELLEMGLVNLPIENMNFAEETDIMNSVSSEQLEPEQQNYIDLFHQSVDNFPENIAIVDGPDQHSYRWLNAQANHLATLLEERFEVRPDDRVVIALPRGASLVSCLLAVSKLSAVFVPLDPSHPEQRLAEIIEKVRCKLVLTSSDVERHLKPLISTATLNVDDASIFSPLPIGDITDSSDKKAPTPGAENLAYIIFTSGSTGEPKGVMVRQRGLINLVSWSQREFQIDSESRVSSIASPAFDAFVWEVLPALCSGAAVHSIPPSISRNTQEITAYLQHHGITVSFLPPAICEEACLNFADRLQRTTLLTGGDVLNSIKSTPCKVYNNYGPTEFSVVATSKLISDSVSTPYSIGQAIDHCEVLILDKRKRLSPMGVAGEIALAGPGIAAGYWDDEKTTEENFIPHPLISTEKIYLTGDKGKWREDGDLEFLGRIDDQISLRGHRIEPREIEKQLLSHPQIRHAAVCVTSHTENGNKILVAYYVAEESDNEIEPSKIRFSLSSHLPQYMIPARYIRLDELPLNDNGKVDRKYLAGLPLKERASSTYSAPQSDTEIQVAKIWQQVLELDQVDVNDSFLEVGGHSLSATRVISQLKVIYNFEIPLIQIFETPILADFAKQMDILANAAKKVGAAPSEVKKEGIGRINRDNYKVNE